MPLGLFRRRNVAVANVVGVLWAAAMFAWFFLSALYLQLVLGYSPLQVGLAFLPANLIMGAFSIGLSAKLVHALRHQAAARSRAAARVGRAAALRARAGRRHVPRRRPAEHDPARDRRRHRVQPDAARRDERRRAGGVGPGLGRRQHRVHDGRRARPRRAREPRRVSHRHARRRRARSPRRARSAATTSRSSSARSSPPPRRPSEGCSCAGRARPAHEFAGEEAVDFG